MTGDQIATVEELEALPVGTVYGHPEHPLSVFLRVVDGPGAVWRMAGSGEHLYVEAVPLGGTLLYRPDRPTGVTREQVEALAMRLYDFTMADRGLDWTWADCIDLSREGWLRHARACVAALDLTVEEGGR